MTEFYFDMTNYSKCSELSQTNYTPIKKIKKTGIFHMNTFPRTAFHYCRARETTFQVFIT